MAGWFRTRAPARPAAPPGEVVIVTEMAADDEPLRAVRDAVLHTGDWRPAADLLAATPDPDRRGARVEGLSRAVRTDPGWADRWLSACPHDGAATLVRGWGEVHRAWAARGDGYAETVTDGGATLFRRRLETAHALCARAIELAPGDPTGFVPALWLAIGQQESHEVFGQRWGRLMALDPRNRLGHVAALQYWSAKWFGSHEHMFGFARWASAAAPGTWAVVLPLQAHIEWALEEGAGADYWWRSPAVRADIDAALRWAAATPTHALALHDLSVLGYVLHEAGRAAEAGRLFARTGYRSFEYPWYYATDDPAEAFGRAVARAVHHGHVPTTNP